MSSLELDQWIPQVGRIYIESKQALDRTDNPSLVAGAFEYARQFNTVYQQILETGDVPEPVLYIGQISSETSSRGSQRGETI